MGGGERGEGRREGAGRGALAQPREASARQRERNLAPNSSAAADPNPGGGGGCRSQPRSREAAAARPEDARPEPEGRGAPLSPSPVQPGAWAAGPRRHGGAPAAPRAVPHCLGRRPEAGARLSPWRGDLPPTPPPPPPPPRQRLQLPGTMRAALSLRGCVCLLLAAILDLARGECAGACGSPGGGRVRGPSAGEGRGRGGVAPERLGSEPGSWRGGLWSRSA